MTSVQVRNAYRRTEKMATIHPVKLIHLMYERTIAHLDQAMEGIKEGNVLKRGENLGKAIAIITELNASIKNDDQSKAASFLRGLYTAILLELPKVSVSNEMEIAVKAKKYMQRLMEIWEQTAMRENGLLEEAAAGKQGEQASSAEPMEAAVTADSVKSARKTAENAGSRSVSVSI